jgi:hypothetical protein
MESDVPIGRRVSDAAAVADVLRTSYASARVIVIDGWMASGKSCLANALAAQFAVAHCDLDAFLQSEREVFYSALRLDHLRSEIAKHQRIIVSGVCVLQVMEALHQVVDVLVYVQRMAVWGWADADEVEGAADTDLRPLACEVRAYHRRYRPHERADIVVERME